MTSEDKLELLIAWATEVINSEHKICGATEKWRGEVSPEECQNWICSSGATLLRKINAWYEPR